MTPSQLREFAKRLAFLATSVEGVANSMDSAKIQFLTIENLASGHLSLDRLSAFLSGIQKGSTSWAREPLPPDRRLKKKKAETEGKQAKK